jgi:hypothetical protein
VSTLALAAAGALPWVLAPLIVLWRARASRSLDEHPATSPDDAPGVSVIIPARDEARNIDRCARSVLASSYPSLEVLVVDDHSTDATGEIARAIAREDARLRVIVPPPLPEGWFGKQWACATGAHAARGALLVFTDADTVHAPDLITRSVHAMRARDADLFSIIGRQELGSFWERLLQPQVFFLLGARYGGTETVERSRRAVDKIANGQCIFVRRKTYESLGGHAMVRDKVAEDLALAQRCFAAGGRVGLALGPAQLSTRMYTSLSELVHGWGKNIFAGGREAMPGGRVGRALFPVLLLLPPLFALVPFLAFAAGAAGLASSAMMLWGAAAAAAFVLWWAAIYRRAGVSPFHALAAPVAAVMLLWIIAGAIARGERVRWKGRAYRSA